MTGGRSGKDISPHSFRGLALNNKTSNLDFT